MPPPSPLPLFVYKILSEEPPSQLPDALPLSALDAEDGFIHLSSAEQVPATAARFYSDVSALWLLKIPLENIRDGVKWEQAGSEYFPHLYDKNLGQSEVVEIQKVIKDRQGDWKISLHSIGRLV